MDQHGILLPLMKVEEGSVHSRTVLFQDLGCDQALAPDPYESKLVQVASSSRRNGGEGIFAKKFLESNTIISFYFGERVSPQDFNLDSWDGNCYKIFDPRDYPRGTIDIPAWAQVSSAYSYIFFDNRSFRALIHIVQLWLTRLITVSSQTLSSLFMIIHCLESSPPSSPSEMLRRERRCLYPMDMICWSLRSGTGRSGR